ncbi:MAG TPA: T9SS type A sorting domain-containing protein [Flavobacteriales bacterium]|nr:T9SS type A sorting domain-containing protein [Flavobacteriales bacterium]
MFPGNPGSGCCTGQSIPNNSDPNNLIAFAWEDLDPGTPGGGTIEYFTKGTAPNRTLIVNFIGVPHWPGPSPNLDVTSQVVLYETTNVIEIHTTNMTTDGGLHTMGIENMDGSDAVAFPGRNASGTWSAINEGVIFEPLQIAGYSVEWYDGSGNLIDTIDDISVSPTTQSTYTVVITDLSNGCSIVDSITINASPAMSVTVTSQDATCGLDDGEGTVTVSGGNTPYTYLWNDPMAQTTNTATGLPIGVYDVLVSDANGCSDSAMVAISNVGAPTIGSPVVTNVSCYSGSDGTATVSPTGGTTPYYYSWDDPNGQTNATANGLPAGTYIVSVSSSDSCTSTAIAIVTEPAELTVNASASSAGCGSNDGEAWVAASGGTMPYTFLWDDPMAQTTDTAFNLVAGVYNVTVTDGNGCTSQTLATVGNPSAPTATLISSTDASCYGSEDGIAVVSATGGTPPYTYLWDDPMAQTTPTATGLPAGSYVATITDNSGCIASVSVTIGQPPAISFPYIETFDSNTPLNSGSPGNPVIILDNGWENDQKDGQDWAPRSAPTNSSSTGPLTDHTTGSGNFIYVEDGFDNDSVNLLSPCMNLSELCGPSLSFWYHSFNGNSPSDSSSLHLDILYGGSWNLDIITPISIEADAWQQKIVDLSAFQDAVTIRFRVNNNNITPFHDIAIDDVEIFGQGNMTTSVSSTDASCYGYCDGEATAIATNGNPPIMYSWDDPSSQTNSTATGLCAGTYVVSITDSAGCISNETVTIGEPAVLSTSTLIDTATTGNSDGGATVTVTGGSSPYNYLWNDPANQTTASATGLSAGTYSCDITDANGCSTQVVVTITEITGIWNYNAQGEFELYPNPTTGKVQLEIFIPGENIFEIRILNVLGEAVDQFTVKEKNRFKRTLNLKHLPNGVYIVQLKTGTLEINKQVVLTH